MKIFQTPSPPRLLCFQKGPIDQAITYLGIARSMTLKIFTYSFYDKVNISCGVFHLPHPTVYDDGGSNHRPNYLINGQQIPTIQNG